MIILKFIITALISILWLYILTYIMKLEKIGCKCSEGWKRTFIKYYIIVILVFLVIQMFEFKLPIEISLITSFVKILFTIAFVFIVFNYVNYLKETKCQCSIDVKRDVLEIFNYIQMFLLIIVFVIMIYTMFVVSHAMGTKKTLKKMTK